MAPNQKKSADSEYAAFEFHTKKISIVGIGRDILDKIHKFPFPVQQMLGAKACAVEGRIEKGKPATGLTSLDCSCLFYHFYLLLCRYIFHEHMYSITKLLTTSAWRRFLQMFQECGFEVYIRREIVKVDAPEKTKAERASDNQRKVCYK
ncbi:hypothetical protein C2G38_2027081 [Gigaspora rosea]|uniref:Uncharacterized protein n=1 Tax=Gigaspora rosea TaxID=44941 RepID=A0A397W922_9GLOM|nr:hypothetical protein C2G38_2027081 [Gigaspora rosea]